MLPRFFSFLILSILFSILVANLFVFNQPIFREWIEPKYFNLSISADIIKALIGSVCVISVRIFGISFFGKDALTESFRELGNIFLEIRSMKLKEYFTFQEIIPIILLIIIFPLTLIPGDIFTDIWKLHLFSSFSNEVNRNIAVSISAVLAYVSTLFFEFRKLRKKKITSKES
jgi:hypothetical protein